MPKMGWLLHITPGKYLENPGFSLIFSQKGHNWAGLTKGCNFWSVILMLDSGFQDHSGKLSLAHLILVRFGQTNHQNDQHDQANWMKRLKSGNLCRTSVKSGIPAKSGKLATLITMPNSTLQSHSEISCHGCNYLAKARTHSHFLSYYQHRDSTRSKALWNLHVKAII